ncbi:MAG: hypothetical protein D6814_11325, partial [Calditrichaeota bacterium]
KYIHQGKGTDRTIEQTLDIGWELISTLPKPMLKRIRDEYLEKYYRGKVQEADQAKQAAE